MHNTGNNDAHQGVSDPLDATSRGVGTATYRAMTDSGLKTISDAGEPSIARSTSRHSPQIDREKPDTTDVSGDRSAPTSPPSRWRRPLLILGPVALVVGALALYLMTGRYVSEDDAYVQAVSVSISPQVAGQVVSIAARSNTRTRKDDPLFNLDPEPYRIALANAEAQLGIARDQVRTLIETYRARLKQIDEARATADYAQTTYERQQHLYDTGAAPRATLDAAIRDLQAAKANLASLEREAAAALAQLGGNPDMPVDQQSAVKQAQAADGAGCFTSTCPSACYALSGFCCSSDGASTGLWLDVSIGSVSRR
jgi:membrane fusion protein (multidrug efflux system)